MNQQENKDFYYNENGYIVFTEQYLLNRGFCCGNGCRHCPYDKSKVKSQKQKVEERFNDSTKL